MLVEGLRMRMDVYLVFKVRATPVPSAEAGGERRLPADEARHA